ncbi:TPA: adhesin [Escherichia coli]|nr:adhesin [Escherichia coli]
MKNSKSIYILLITIIMPSFLQATEINLYSHDRFIHELRDGTKLVTGRIRCPEGYTAIHVWINSREDKGHYFIQGNKNRQHEVKVRLEGDDWHPSTRANNRGIEKSNSSNQAIFYVVVDGKQQPVSDEYTFSISSSCLDKNL